MLKKLVSEGIITDPSSAKGRLIQAAARLFRDKGYERTTVRDLAAEVGILSGSLFHHFKNKERILRAVMEEAILLNTETMRAALAQALTPEDKVLALIKCELASILGDTGAAMTVLVFEWRSLNEDSQQHILGLRDIYETLWMDALKEAKEANLVVIDPFILRRLLTGALSWTVNWYEQDGKMDLDELARNALSLAVKSS
ncbi:TetR/AcrR family transcriptional regulator [Litoribacillus peritrichatus]|uniref:Atu genes transcriptional repressor AtuR n=1 Tax=Litoribacillus peritrichatus TaxID=718191 RepID=A0ABP7MBC6_9GAMM